MAKIRCPRLSCRSIDCTPVAQKNKYSIGKGAVGAVVGGVFCLPLALVGAAAGLNGKKQVKMMCNKCGKMFTVKI